MPLFTAYLRVVAATTTILAFQNCANADDFAFARAEARHDLALAKLELRHYLQVEYPRERRYVNAEIKLAEAQAAACRRGIRFSLFDEHSTGRWTQAPCVDRRLCQLEAELRLQDLLAERTSLVRAHALRWRMLEQCVQQARLRVADLEGGASIILETAARN